VIYLVRHAHAGRRTKAPEDHLRALSKKGKRESQALAAWLAPQAGARVLSSPYVRCVETVAPIAAKGGRKTLIRTELSEAASLERLMRLIARAHDGTIMCTHGDMLKAVIAQLASDGTTIDGDACWEKGSAWALAPGRRGFRRAVAIPPLTPPAQALAILDGVAPRRRRAA